MARPRRDTPSLPTAADIGDDWHDLVDAFTDLDALADRFSSCARWALHGSDVGLPDLAADPADTIDQLDALLAELHAGRRLFAWRATFEQVR